MKVFITTGLDPVDTGQGGIKRVIEAQHKYLPQYGWDVVTSERDADVVAMHAGDYVNTSKPVVAHCHGLHWNEYGWPDWAHSLNGQVVNVLRRCDAATAPSDWVGYAIKRGMNIDARTVYHGVDMAEWEPTAVRNHPYVLWNKTRVDAICDPAPVNQLARLLPDVQFVTTFGDAASNTKIVGRLPYEQAKNLVRASTVYLATSRETFGIGTLEAMAAGAVVVGYDWGGQREIIMNGVNGLLVTPGDVSALAAAVQDALTNYDALSAGARAQAQIYTWDGACEAYAALYKQVYEQRATKRVSVVVTCYNLAHVLPRAVASVDDPDAEIIIVNDASPDDTESVATSLAAADERIRVISNDTNLYLAESLNVGVAAAQGRYIVPLDADNELGAGALRTLADALDAQPDVDVAYGRMQLIPEAGPSFVSSWPEQFVFERQLAHRNQIPSTSMYRRKWWERAGGYRRRCRTAEDADFWCRITSLGAQPRKVTEQPTLIYHDRRDGMSHVEADWPWEAWYSWSRNLVLTPFGAPAARRKSVPTYEPAIVTVVIPVGQGHEKYLPDALDSLVGQTFLNWRCIVVDDRPDMLVASPTSISAATMPLPPWAERRVTGGGNNGPARARNHGLYAATTPYVLFLDADDYLAPNALALLVQAALSRGGVAAREWYYSDWYKQEEGKVYKAPDFVAEHMRTHLTHSVTAMYPAAALRDLGGFDEQLNAWEDWDLVLKLIEADHCGVHVPYPLFYYRYHAGQRRELLYANRRQHTEVMRTKWRKYMVEGAPMSCGCQGGKTFYSPPVQVGGAVVPTVKEGMTLVEFIGHSAPRTWRGSSGTEYRFGSDDGHKMHYVANEDVQTFMNRHDFRLALGGAGDAVGDDTAVLQAAGPPDRNAEFAVPPAVVA